MYALVRWRSVLASVCARLVPFRSVRLQRARRAASACREALRLLWTKQMCAIISIHPSGTRSWYMNAATHYVQPERTNVCYEPHRNIPRTHTHTPLDEPQHWTFRFSSVALQHIFDIVRTALQNLPDFVLFYQAPNVGVDECNCSRRAPYVRARRCKWSMRTALSAEIKDAHRCIEWAWVCAS